MTDLDRVRAHLDAGRDVCPTDWNNFNTPDHGKPIMRIAARIRDLKDEGYPVERTGTRNHCAVYTRVAAKVSGASPEPHSSGADLKTTGEAPETPALFALEATPFSAWDAA